MPGMMRLVNAAASMTPAAKPSIASNARSEGFRQTNTSDAPNRLRVAMMTPPTKACSTGDVPTNRTNPSLSATDIRAHYTAGS